MRESWATGLIAALALTSMSPSVAAQESSGEQPSFPAPKSLDEHQSGEATFFYTGTAYTFLTWDDGLIGNPDLLRRAEAVTEADKIWRATDLALTSLTESRGQPVTRATMILDVGPDGRVARCTAEERRGNDIVLAAQACPVVKERMRYTPALALDGRPAADQQRFGLSFYHNRIKSGEAPSAFQPLLSAPAPWPVLDATDPGEWPMIREGRPSFRASVKKQAVPLAPVSLNSPDEKIASIAFSRTKDDEKSCQVVIPSGDPGLDDSACDFMRKKHDPLLDLPTYGKTTMPYLVVGKGKADRAYAPVARLGQWPKLDITAEELTRDRIESAWGADAVSGASLDPLSVALALDAEGRPTDCRIRQSSGSDAGDVLACKVIKESLHFTPANDIFGQPALTRLRGWFAKRPR